MIDAYLLVKWLHVLVMGYWIGSDLVVNQLTHYVTHATALDGQERTRLWSFLLHVDQHPRNALILSVPLGFSLAAWLGISPIAGGWLVLLWALSALWLAFMWYVHLRRDAPSGPRLRAWDWRWRYLLIGACLVTGAWSLTTGSPFTERWLALKILLFGGVLACGVVIRHYIRAVVRVWPAIQQGRSTPLTEAAVRTAMTRGTWVLAVLHVQLFAIAYLGLFKPV
jgi:hypothetical protein